VSLKFLLKGWIIYNCRKLKKPHQRGIKNGQYILEQLSKYFKEMIQEIMLKEREAYLKDHIKARGNGYYRRTPKMIFGDMELIP